MLDMKPEKPYAGPSPLDRKPDMAALKSAEADRIERAAPAPRSEPKPDILAANAKRFDKVAYQREYMRKRRAADKASRATAKGAVK